MILGVYVYFFMRHLFPECPVNVFFYVNLMFVSRKYIFVSMNRALPNVLYCIVSDVKYFFLTYLASALSNSCFASFVT